MSDPAVPSFYLYGEPHCAVADGFLHVEALDDRSRPSGWTIRPHSHASLVQLFLITAGGGTMAVEAETLTFVAPALLLLPAGVAHGFAWTAESAGFVLTMAQSYAADVCRRDADLAALFASARVVGCDPSATSAAAAILADLRRELGWSAPGHRAAVEGALLILLATALRALDADGATRSSPSGPHAALVARYRARIDDRFRRREPVADHAAALGVSESRLRLACARIAAASPAALLDQRAMLEARRGLLYSDLSIAAIGFGLGFDDAAYFSRFFARHEGHSPRAFRLLKRR